MVKILKKKKENFQNDLTILLILIFQAFQPRAFNIRRSEEKASQIPTVRAELYYNLDRKERNENIRSTTKKLAADILAARSLLCPLLLRHSV